LGGLVSVGDVFLWAGVIALLATGMHLHVPRHGGNGVTHFARAAVLEGHQHNRRAHRIGHKPVLLLAIARLSADSGADAP
jgi:hypothetical protein